MKILQVNNVYKRGSTGKIVHDIHTFLKQSGIKSIVCYGRGQIEKEANVYKTSSEILAKFNALRSRIIGLQYNGSIVATKKLINIIKMENPDVVHLQCINGYFVNIYKLMEYLKKNKIPTVLTLHAEFMYTGSCGHAYECEKWKTGCGNCPQLWIATKSYWFDRTNIAWWKMKNAFEGFEHLQIVAVSRWLEDRAKKSPIIKGYSTSVIHNGLDTSVFKPIKHLEIIKKLGIKNEKIILHVTPSFTLNEDDIKGGHYIVKLANKLIGENIKIIVVGGRDLSLELPDNIINIGRVNNQNELAQYYSIAHLTVLTSKRETYSMVCAESLCCGTPVVGFYAGAPETITIKEYSEFVEYGDVEKLSTVALRWISVKNEAISNNLSEIAQEKYSRNKMGMEYFKIYKELNQKK